MRINFSEYQLQYIKTGDIHNHIQRNLKTYAETFFRDLPFEDVWFHNMATSLEPIDNDNPDKHLMILFNATMNNDPTQILSLDDSKRIYNIQNNYKLFLPITGNDNFIIYSENNIPLAEFDEKNNVLYVLFPIFDCTAEYDPALAIIYRLFTDFGTWLNNRIILRFSWLNAENRKSLEEDFVNTLAATFQTRLANTRQSLEATNNNIRNYMQKLKNQHDAARQYMRELQMDESSLHEIFDDVAKNLALMEQHPKITDIFLHKNIISFKTVPLTIYADNGHKYYGGEFTVKINMDNTDVRFDSTEKHKSYWTADDPHPHVNGSTGQACLGNISTTIAELCSQKQLYALALICIDFCESANTSDSAGACVKNWDMVDDEGNKIPEDERPDRKFICWKCNNSRSIDQRHMILIDCAYSADDDDYYDFDEVGFCDRCYDNYTHCDERLGQVYNDLEVRR